MKHVWAFLIKFTAIGIVLFSLLSIFVTASLSSILFITLVTTVVAYLAGDLFILPRFGNFSAVVADFGLSFGLTWFLGSLLIESSAAMLWTTFVAGLSIGAIEALFHVYMKNHVLSDKAKSFVPGVYQEDKMLTEFSEDFDKTVISKNKDNSKKR